MHVEDHPKEYQDFEGVIPKGEYGGGTVIVWDRGTWKSEGDAAEMYRRGRLSFELEGEKLRGGFHLVRTAGGAKAGERRWLLMKRSDDAAQPGTDDAILEERPESVISGRELDDVAKDPDHVWTSKEVNRGNDRARRAKRAVAQLTNRPGIERAKLPAFVEPVLATLVDVAPEGKEWVHELKLDGYRIMARVDGPKVKLLSRRSIDWTGRMPSIASAFSALQLESGMIDGEVVVLDEAGKSSFQRLQNSLDAGKDAACVYFAFDAPFLDGFDLRKLPLTERKAILEERFDALGKGHPRLRYSEHITGDGPLFFSRAGSALRASSRSAQTRRTSPDAAGRGSR
jgi:bifunctional non-homologous end joining protein LigD